MSFIDTLMYDLENLPRYRSFARWLLRICVFIYLFLIYLKRLATMEITSDYFLLAVSYLILAFILLIGGFYKRSTITRMSAIGMIILTIIYFAASILLGKDLYQMLTSKILLVGVLVYFATSSNWKEYKHRRKAEQELFDEGEGNK
jgi:hypothetical protein